MTTPTPLSLRGNDYLLVSVPEAKEYWTNNGFLHIGELEGNAFSIMLPPGNYQFIAIDSELTGEIAMNIVEVYCDDFGGITGYCNYLNDDDICDTAIESYQSFKRSKGLEGNLAILKKI